MTAPLWIPVVVTRKLSRLRDSTDASAVCGKKCAMIGVTSEIWDLNRLLVDQQNCMHEVTLQSKKAFLLTEQVKKCKLLGQ